jgi:predicted flap endonuclease-1-like 5' DNA nuclease
MTNRLLGLVVTFTAVLLLATLGARGRRRRLEAERERARGNLATTVRGERGGRRRRQRSARPAAASAAGEGTALPSGDDLKLIEGVGPRMEDVLRGAGITTFAALAGSTRDGLVDVIRAAGARMAEPETWPEQARLAAAGRWDELRALQETLKGGRRVEGGEG